jgi:hypothetical protein
MKNVNGEKRPATRHQKNRNPPSASRVGEDGRSSIFKLRSSDFTVPHKTGATRLFLTPAQRLRATLPDEIVREKAERNGCGVIFDLLAERIRQPSVQVILSYGPSRQRT